MVKTPNAILFQDADRNGYYYQANGKLNGKPVHRGLVRQAICQALKKGLATKIEDTETILSYHIRKK
jgi:hypothetical protein